MKIVKFGQNDYFLPYYLKKVGIITKKTALKSSRSWKTQTLRAANFNFTIKILQIYEIFD